MTMKLQCRLNQMQEPYNAEYDQDNNCAIVQQHFPLLDQVSKLPDGKLFHSYGFQSKKRF